MTTKNVIEGLKTLSPYYDSDDSYDLGAEHDIIYAFSTDRPLSIEDQAKMYDLGWIQDEVPYDDEEDAHGPYDPEESWCARV